MLRGARSDGCADSYAAACCHLHHSAHADLNAHCASCGCNCIIAGAHRHPIARADGTRGAHAHSHIGADARAGTNPDRCAARG